MAGADAPDLYTNRGAAKLFSARPVLMGCSTQWGGACKCGHRALVHPNEAHNRRLRPTPSPYDVPLDLFLSRFLYTNDCIYVVVTEFGASRPTKPLKNPVDPTPPVCPAVFALLYSP